MDKTQILKELQKLKNFRYGTELAQCLGISQTRLSNWMTRNTFNIDIVTKAFPEVREEWLISGTGPMLKDSQNETSEPMLVDMKTVPLLPMAAICGSLNDDDWGAMESECTHIGCPRALPAELAVTVSGESMLPHYPVGAQVFVRKVEDPRYLELGREYLINTIHGTAIKVLKSGSSPDEIRCESFNPNFEPYTVKKSDIRSVWQIIAVFMLK